MTSLTAIMRSKRLISLLCNTVNTRNTTRCCVPVRRYSYDGDGKTSVHILNHDSEVGLMIDSYSQMGFRLNNGLVVLGPMAIFPRSVLSWNVSGPEEIDEDSLSLFTVLEPKLDILVLGVGDNTRDSRVTKDLIAFMRKYKINVEALPTEQACATFNFLNAEGRYIAGALIPPNLLRVTDDDVIVSKMKYNKLYGPEGDGSESLPAR